MQGYDQLCTSAAWKDLSSRGRILTHGEDSARLLHAMSSNHVNALQDGEGCYAFFLNALGRIQSDATILRCGAQYLIDTEAKAHEVLYAHLDKFIIADDVTLEDLAASHFEFGIEGPEAALVAAGLGLPLPAPQNGVVAFGGIDDDAQARWLLQGRKFARIVVESLEEGAALSRVTDVPVVHVADIASGEMQNQSGAA